MWGNICTNIETKYVYEIIYHIYIKFPNKFSQFIQQITTNFCKAQSRLSSGQTCLVLSQREMQWKWKAWLQIPHATTHSFVVADAWLAWHSIPIEKIREWGL